MKNSIVGAFIVLWLSLVGFMPLGASQDDASLLLPSEMETRIIDSLMVLCEKGEIKEIKEFEPARSRITMGMIGRVRSKGLERPEMFIYGRLLDWAGRHDDVFVVMENLGRGADAEARSAWRWMISEYRRKFEPDPDYLDGLYEPVTNLARRYNEMNEPEEAIRLCMEELQSLSFDAPYRSFGIAEDMMPLLVEADRIAECRTVLERFEAGLRDALSRCSEDTSGSDSTARAGGPVREKYQDLVAMYGLLQRRLDLIGGKAPTFKFEYVYNVDSTLTLDDFAGTVLVVDFWATWCLPCLEEYKELQRLYDEFNGRGVEILGVTSFQGTYWDRDTGTTEGSDEEPLSREREIEVTRSFIEEHHMIWPCAFSDRSVFDPEYTVTAIPTVVILDREGIVRFFHSGLGCEQQVRRIVSRLIPYGIPDEQPR